MELHGYFKLLLQCRYKIIGIIRGYHPRHVLDTEGVSPHLFDDLCLFNIVFEGVDCPSHSPLGQGVAQRTLNVLSRLFDRPEGRFEVFFGEANDPRLLHHAVYYSCFGRLVADRLIQFPIMSSGAFAARRNHPIWIAWQQACHRAMQNGPYKHSEQAALNYAIYNNNAAEQRPHLLPSLANWSCALALSMWDPERRKLVEPNLPHAPIGLVHLNGLRDPVRLATPQGRQIETAMTYAGIRSLMAREAAAR